MKTKLKFEKSLIRKLHGNYDTPYEDASIYTVLLDLIQDSSIEEVFTCLHNVACDLNKRKTLEAKFDEAKKWKW